MTSTIKALSASNDNLTQKSNKSFLKTLIDGLVGISRSLHRLMIALDDIITRGDIRAFAERIVDNENQNAA